MSHRLARLALGTAVAAAALLPAGAHASTCNEDQFPEVCHAVYVACNATYPTYKVCSQIR
jgi:hypothetical protein